MVHVHGRHVSDRAASVPPDARIAVPVDVGKHSAMALVADVTGDRLVAPFTFGLDRPGIASLISRVRRVVDDHQVLHVEVGVEAAGHYHRPLTASELLPAESELIELYPAQLDDCATSSWTSRQGVGPRCHL